MTNPAPATPAAPITPDPKAPVVPAGAAPAPGTPPNPSAAKPPAEPVPEFKPLEVVVDGRKLVIQTQDQLVKAVQRSIYADQEIKNAAQAKKGAEALMQKLKTKEGLREVLTDPEIGHDMKKLAIEWVREFMEEEKLSPSEREARKLKAENEGFKKEKEEATQRAEQEKKQKEVAEKATAFREEIIAAIDKSDLPKDQMTMDACIQIMRSAYKRFGKVLPAEKAMEIVSKQYWSRLQKHLESWEPEKILERFGQKTLDKIQKLELERLRQGSRKPGTPPTPPPAPEGKKKKDTITEKEWLERAKQREASIGLGGL